jgi:hypothetical protein
MMAAPACRLSCRCCTEQSGRHPCSVDRSRNRVHSKHSPRLAHGLAAAASACPVVVQSSNVKQNQYLRLLSTFLLGKGMIHH